MKTLLTCALLAATALAPSAHAERVLVPPVLTGDITWTAQNEYVLTNYTYVVSGATLRIEPGTVIRGTKGEEIISGGTTNYVGVGVLYVTQGAKIYAEGTPTRPIIFTADTDDLSDPEDLLPTDRAQWGGVVLLGRARINFAVDAAGDAANPKYEVYEGLEDVEINGQRVHRYGGNDDDDNSGVLRYVSIRHGGSKLRPDKEINGLSMGAVGRGTTVEYIEVLAIADDGFEFFGGTVNTRYLVSAFCDDDTFDTDMGYSGKNQFWFGIQSNDARDEGGELNGEPNERNSGSDGDPAQPISTFTVYNATLLGAGVDSPGATSGNDTFTIRRKSRTQWYNSVFHDFMGQPFNGGGPVSGAMPMLADNLWGSFRNPVFTNELFTTTTLNNVQADPQLRGITRDLMSYGLDPRPAPGSPALSGGRSPTDPYYHAAAYKGAFGMGNWASDWTALSAYGILTAAGGMNPVDMPNTPSIPVEVNTTLDGSTLVLTWTGGTGPFTVQRKNTLSDATWINLPETPTSDRTLSVPVTGDAGFFRVMDSAAGVTNP
jgi:hypothetical protein